MGTVLKNAHVTEGGRQGEGEVVLISATHDFREIIKFKLVKIMISPLQLHFESIISLSFSSKNK